jgi:hypothetical protein
MHQRGPFATVLPTRFLRTSPRIGHDRSVSYTNFFLGSVTVAGALTGLLFVALSVAQARGRGLESAEHQAVAATAFTALVDSLWVSLVALLPGSAQNNGGIATASFLLGLLGVSSTARR